jgi:hypothetical protein
VKRTLVVFVGAAQGLWPAQALAQVPVYPNGAATQPPVNLDPGATGTQAPAPPPQQAPQAPRTNVIVVKPDGTVTDSAADATNAAPSGYYLGGGNVAPPSSGGEPAEIHSGAVPELHVVRSGDTLWDICWYYFNDPWQWPKIWSYNPQITNPHWIYPGDLVRLLPRGMFAQTGPEPDAEQIKPPDTLPPPAKRLEVGVKQTAFVEKSDLDRSITVDGAVDEKVLLGNGDEVYLSYPANKPPKVGETYSIYKPDNPVKADGKEVGAYVHLLGTLKVESVKQDKRAKGIIIDANQEIERGAKVGPLARKFANVPPSQPKVDAQGSIVAMLTRDQLIGQGEVVFVDLGKGSGVEIGNRMYVVRRGDGYPGHMSSSVGQDDRRFPARALGEIVIVEVGDKISIGLITLSVQEMSIGDIVIMQASPAK